MTIQAIFHTVLKPLALFLITMQVLTTSCGRVSNSADDIILRCGSMQAPPQESFYYIQLMVPNGAINDFFSQDDIKIQLTDKQLSPKRFSMNLSSKGCIGLPKELLAQANLQVFVKNSQLSALKSFSNIPSDNFETLTLQPAIPSKVTLSCADDGIFASKSFRNPISIVESGSIEKSKFILTAEPMETGKPTIRLLSKEFHESMEEGFLASEISVSEIPEGIYYLRLSSASLVDDFGSQPVYLNEKNSCPLTVIKTNPILSSTLFSKQDFFAVKINEKLPIVDSIASGEISYCKQPYRQTSNALATCQDIAVDCINKSDYKPLTSEATDQVGLFYYFFKAIDRAGNESELKCHTIAIVDQPATISLDWQDELWNLPNAYMKKPVSTIKPLITISENQVLPPDIIEKNLQCQVEFVSPSGFTVKGSDVICMSGKCQGMALDDFVPCDQSFSMSIGRAWQYEYINNSSLRLTIKVDIGTGETYTQTRSIGIQTSRWQVESIPDPGAKANRPLNIIALDSNSLLGAFGSQGTFIFNEEKWTRVDPKAPSSAGAKENLTNSQILRDSAGTIFGIFESSVRSNDDTVSSQASFYKFSEGSWMELPDQPGMVDCKFSSPALSIGFICLGSDGKIAFFNGVNWSVYPNQSVIFDQSSLNRLVSLSDHRIAGANSKHIFLLSADGTWQQIFQVPEERPFAIAQLLVSKDQIWIYVTDIETPRLFRLVPTVNSGYTAEEIKTPEIQRSSVNTLLAISTDSEDSLYFFGHKWVEASKSWTKDAQITQAFAGIDAKLDRDTSGKSWYRSRIGFLNVSADTIQFWPTAYSGVEPLLPIMETPDGGFLFQGISANTDNVGIYKIKPKQFITLNKQTSQLRPETFAGTWTNSDGMLQTISYGRGEILTFMSPSWQVTDRFPNSTINGFQEQSLALRDGGMAIILGSGLIIKRAGETTWSYVFKLNDPIQKILPDSLSSEQISIDTLRLLRFIGEFADGSIILGVRLSSDAINLSHLLSIKKDKRLVSKTVESFAVIKNAVGATLTSEGILATVKYPLRGKLETLFALVDSDLVLIRRSTRELSSEYEAKMAEVGPGFEHELFATSLNFGGLDKHIVCAYRTQVKNDNRTGRFFCFHLNTYPKIEIGSYIETPTFDELSRITKDFTDNVLITEFKMISSANENLFILGSDVFKSKSLAVDSEWKSKITKEEIMQAGAKGYIQGFYQDRFGRLSLSLRDAGVIVFD